MAKSVNSLAERAYEKSCLEIDPSVCLSGIVKEIRRYNLKVKGLCQCLMLETVNKSLENNDFMIDDILFFF